MVDRLSRTDLAFLAEPATAPRHNATIDIFDPGDAGFDYARLVDLIRDRLAFVPRYRQRIQCRARPLAHPLWVDDEDFDLAFHVRRSALPRPGSRPAAGAGGPDHVPPARPDPPAVGGLLRRGARGRPGRPALQDPPGARRRGARPSTWDSSSSTTHTGRPRFEPDEWAPRSRAAHRRARSWPARSATRHDSQTVVNTVRGTSRPRAPRTPHPTARSVAGAVDRPRQVPESRSARALAAAPVGDRRDLPGRLPQGAQGARRHGQRRDPGDRHRRLRSWLMTRAESMGGIRQVRAVVPLGHRRGARGRPRSAARSPRTSSTCPSERRARSSGCTRSPTRSRRTRRPAAAWRPTGSPASPASRRRRSTRSGRGSPPTSCAAATSCRSPTCPGPQSPLYAAGAEMLASYPVAPLLPGHPLVISVTSYNGGVFYGITADRDLVPDADLLGICIREALDELLEVSLRRHGTRAPRGRRRAASPPGPTLKEPELGGPTLRIV